MAEDLFSISLDTTGLIKAMVHLLPGAEKYTIAAAEVTATRVRDEAQRRLQRSTKPDARGVTLRSIQIFEGVKRGPGFAVIPKRAYLPSLPFWIETGTQKGKPGSHTMPPRPFLDPAVELEQAAHQRRMIEAVQQAIRESGLGD